MARKYTKVEQLTEIVKERHDQGETYGEIATSLGLKKKQVQKLMERREERSECWPLDTFRAPRGTHARSQLAKKQNRTMNL